MHIFENYFIKAIEHFFRVYIASSKHLESWENCRKLRKFTSQVCITVLNFPNPPINAIEHSFGVYIASSKHLESWENCRSHANLRLRFA